MLKLVIITLVILFFCILYTNASPNQENTFSETDLVSDFLFNETISPVGKEFFDLFVSRWENPTSIKNLSIKVIEKPIPGMGTRIYIEIGDNIVYNTFLRPNRELIENAAKNATQTCVIHVEYIEKIEKQLENEDQTGTGVF